MIEVTVAYPAGQGRTFNMDYYLKTHIPLFQKRMGAAMKTIRVSRGIGGSTPRSPAAFVAMVHATFDSAEVFASRFCSTRRRAPRGRAELYQYSAGRADQRSADGVSLPLGDERGGQLARDRTIVERAGIVYAEYSGVAGVSCHSLHRR